MVADVDAELEAMRRGMGPELAHKFMCEVPLKFRKASLTNMEDEALAERLRVWDDEQMPMFYSPNPGTGKTWAAIAFAHHLSETRGLRFKYVSAARMFAEMRLSFDGGPAYRPPIGTPIILDDIGKERVSDWVREWLFVLVDAAWSEGVPMIVTSNKTSKNIASVVGDAVADRMRDMLVTVEVLGESRRGK